MARRRRPAANLLRGRDSKGHIAAEVRDDWARRALDIFERMGSRAAGLSAVEEEFDVSSPTARNLVGRGRFLRAQGF